MEPVIENISKYIKEINRVEDKWQTNLKLFS